MRLRVFCGAAKARRSLQILAVTSDGSGYISITAPPSSKRREHPRSIRLRDELGMTDLR